MKQLGCMRTGMMLDRRAAGLSAAEALRLEEHLASCERCSRDAQLLGGLRAIAHDLDGTLAPHTRARVIAGAFARVHAQRSASEHSRVHASLRLAAVFALAAGAAFALRAVLTQAPQLAPNAGASTMAQVVAPPGDRVLAGAIEVAGRRLETNAALDRAGVMHANTDARIALAHATIELRAGSDARWDGPAHLLRLDTGSVVADVDPSAHQPFAIETARFRVLVLGTRFEVTQDGVRVERGRVRVVAADGSVLAAQLVAGEAYVYEQPDAAVEGTSGHERASRGRGRHTKGPVATAGAPARAGAAELIEQARVQLGNKQVGSARATIDSALALSPEARLRAEALTLRAECALVDGDHAAAIEAYLRVARAFAELPAGENALFAAARLEADRERSAAAAQLLERYLERYPHGRFEREARARLGKLSAALDRAQ
jgi:hypothetical protein